MRERFASWLHQAGALGAVMRLRKHAPVPHLSIVTYHHIADEDPDYPFDATIADATPAQFRRQMELVARYGTPIGIDELVRAIDGEPLPPNPVMVTFDDGYASCHDAALPILRAVGVRATFFVSTSFISERRLYWWERIALLLRQTKVRRATITYPARHELRVGDLGVNRMLTSLVKDTPQLDVERFLDGLSRALEVAWTRDDEVAWADRLIMTWDQVRALTRAGMDVESHGRRHRVLQTLDAAELEDEVTGSRRDLEAQLGRPIRAIAYPVGRRIARLSRIRAAITAAGYRIGLSNKTGVNRVWPLAMRGMLPVDPFDVRRLATDRRMNDAMFLTQIALPRLAYTDPPDKM
jgi:peptidoglycan/xylan/chitin deacetylase (PgdA/CDA1 family)